MFRFTILHKDKKSNARVGKLTTPHGEITTPCFIPVGTQASVKGLAPQELKGMGAQMVLANTYHLLLRPGEDVVKKMGGLSTFMAWDGPTMTDSGGFQVFSLGAAQHSAKKLSKFSKNEFIPEHDLAYGEDSEFIRQVKIKTGRVKPAEIDEEGVTFYSHLNGDKYRLTPESSIKIQEKLGADLIVAFDDHESPLWEYEETKISLDRTNRWALESLQAHKRKDQLMYGVTHGGVFKELREDSAKFTDKHFGAIGIGGAYTSKDKLYEVVGWTVALVAEDKPRHLLGIAEIDDLFEGVERGVDFFDCVAATRRARHGSLYIHPKTGGTKRNKFTMQVTSGKYMTDPSPIDPECDCYTCQHFSRAYLYHLFRAKELLAYRLATYHNVYFITKLVESIRDAIGSGEFSRLKKRWVE
jgi:queuine tRNA-ribosyltransferase